MNLFLEKFSFWT